LNNAARLVTALLIAGAVLTGDAARAGEVFRETFDEPGAVAWSGGARGPRTQIVREGGIAVLRLIGRQQKTLKIPCAPRRDFVYRVRVRGPGGVHFRRGYKVFFKGDGTMWMRRPGAMLLRWVRAPRDLSRFHEIRVVCVGEIVRVYVDDKMELECLDHSPAAGSFSLCGSGDFDEIRISDDIPPNDAVIALPVDAGANFIEEGTYARMKPAERKGRPRVPDTALAFRSDERVRVPVQVLNETKAEVPVLVRARLERFADKVLTAQASKALAVEGGGRGVAGFDFGRVAPGFYCLRLSLLVGGRLVRTTGYPVFVGVPKEPIARKAPTLPVGVLLRDIVWKPIHTKTYWHAIAACLRRHRLNTVVATGGCHREFPEIFERYGIAAMVRSSNRIEYPSVLGLLNSSPNPKRMTALQATYDKPVLTYLPVESIGVGGAEDPLTIWKATRPRVRMLRIHPFRRGRTDWLACREGLSLPEALRRVGAGWDTPWWALLQAAGDMPPKGTYRNPTPAELRAETHLALAFGAKGILYYSFQGSTATVALVDSVSLRPPDDKLRTIGELAALIAEHSDILRGLKPDGPRWRWRAAPFEPAAGVGEPAGRASNAPIVVVSATCTRKPAVYVINADLRRPVLCRLFLPDGVRSKRVRDVYHDKSLVVEGRAVRLNLGPGDGRLLVPGE